MCVPRRGEFISEYRGLPVTLGLASFAEGVAKAGYMKAPATLSGEEVSFEVIQP